MIVRDAGLIALGVVIGVGFMALGAAWLAEDLKRADYITRAIALRYRGPRVQGEG